MSIGITGMDAARSQLDTASHNLVNAETVGFKEFRTILGDVYAQAEAGSVDMSGVNVMATQQQFAQGQLTRSGNAFDLGIDGSGYFVVSDGGERLYSRAGFFHQDKDQFLVNPDGLRLQGFSVDDQGNVDRTKLVDLQIDNKDLPGVASTGASATVNLDARSDPIIRSSTPPTPLDPANPATYHWYAAFNLYDSLGDQHTLGSYFTKTEPSQWEVQFRLDDGPTENKQTLKFDNSGQLTNGDGIFTSLDFLKLDNGAENLELTIDFSATTQFASNHAFHPINVDGQMAGSLSRVTMLNDGYLEASYSNGQQDTLGQVALATFPSDSGLVVDGNNNWRATLNSGSPLYSTSGTSGAGRIRSGTLEQSNVELSSALADVIVAQRNFQMSARAFKAEDTLSQTLINLT